MEQPIAQYMIQGPEGKPQLAMRPPKQQLDFLHSLSLRGGFGSERQLYAEELAEQGYVLHEGVDVWKHSTLSAYESALRIWTADVVRFEFVSPVGADYRPIPILSPPDLPGRFVLRGTIPEGAIIVPYTREEDPNYNRDLLGAQAPEQPAEPVRQAVFGPSIYRPQPGCLLANDPETGRQTAGYQAGETVVNPENERLYLYMRARINPVGADTPIWFPLQG